MRTIIHFYAISSRLWPYEFTNSHWAPETCRVQTCYTPRERYAIKYHVIETCCPGWSDDGTGNCAIGKIDPCAIGKNGHCAIGKIGPCAIG